MISFVSNIVDKKQRFYKIIKLSTLSIFISTSLFITTKTINIISLNSAITNTLKLILQNDKNHINFTKKISLLKSKITLKDIEINVPNGTININRAILKVKNGFILPSTISIEINKLSTQTINGKKYYLQPKQDDLVFDVLINNHFFKKNNFGGIQLFKPTYITISNDASGNNGYIKLDICKMIKNDEMDYFLIEQKGALLLNNIDLIPSIIVVDRPFSWDIQLAEKTIVQNDQDNDGDDVYYLDIKKMIIDYGFSKVNVNGTSTRNKKLQTADMIIKVYNDEKLLDSLFNLATQTRSNSGEIKVIKSTYLKLKNIVVPLLKKNSNNANKKQLVLNIKKQQNKELSLNGILAGEIAKKVIVG